MKSFTASQCEERDHARRAKAPLVSTTRRALEGACADAQLLRLVATNPSALAPLYERYAKRLFGLALAILRSREDAEDLTQDVFASIIAAATSYDLDRGTVGAFLCAMTRSRAIDRLRCRSRSARLLENCRDAGPPPPRTPLECVSTVHVAARVRAVLIELPRAEREVLEMTYYQGLSQREIAADLGTPLGTVKTETRRGLAALSRALCQESPPTLRGHTRSLARDGRVRLGDQVAHDLPPNRRIRVEPAMPESSASSSGIPSNGITGSARVRIDSPATRSLPRA